MDVIMKCVSPEKWSIFFDKDNQGYEAVLSFLEDIYSQATGARSSDF
jgi:hypothetical protein